MIASLVTLLLAALSGIVTFFTRMEDYRRTIDSLAIAKAVERTFVSQENATEALAKISSVADRINLATNILLYASRDSLFDRRGLLGGKRTYSGESCRFFMHLGSKHCHQ